MSGNNPQDAAAKSVEQGFSENELDDIMAEFANLDKELSTQVDSAAQEIEEAQPVAQAAPEEDVLEEVVAEVEIETEPEEVVAQTTPEEVNPLDELSAILAADTPAPAPAEEPVAEFEEAQDVVAETIEEPVVSEELVAQADLEEAMGPSLEQAVAEGFDESEIDAIMKDLEEIDATQQTEVELGFKEEFDVEDEVADHHENVVAMTREVPSQPAKVPSTPTTHAGDIAFSAAGNMNFNVELTIAGSQATLSVVDGCFQLSMNGVDITIDEEGCKALIEGGVNLNIPLPSSHSDKKSNVA